tara:strand:- start:431 stop:703 length:273 start_codon:yes stop_codon:yes gene_type:complete
MWEDIIKRRYISEDDKKKKRNASKDKRMTSKAQRLNMMIQNSGAFSKPVMNLITRDEESMNLFIAKLLEDKKNVDKKLKKLAEALSESEK